VLITAGASNDGVLASAELYDPSTGNWTHTGHLKYARAQHTTCVLTDGKVLAIGGAYEDIGIVITNSTELYDPSTGNWTVTGDLNVPRTFSTASVLADGKVLVVGGMLYESETLNSADLYDPSTGEWTMADDLNNARFLHTASVLTNGKVLVTGGYDEYIQSTVELYDPSTKRWTIVDEMKYAHSSSSVSQLTDEKVLVASKRNRSRPH
jgi:N-acetylneuraminic acid mutarotase